MSPAGISLLLALWSVASLVAEIPAGILADAVSRRLVVAVSPLLDAAGYALWMLWPGFPAFACGFLLLGAGSALRSGVLEALVYAELDRLGAARAFPRLAGRAVAASGVAELAGAGAASLLLARTHGYGAIGLVSVAGSVLCAAAALLLPAGRAGDSAAEDDEHGPGTAGIIRGAFAVLRRGGPARAAVLLGAGITGVAALDEYLPLLARDLGASPAAVPLLVGSVSLCATVGGLLAGWGGRWLGPVLGSAALLVALGAGSGRVVGFAGVALAFGVLDWALARADARLQDAVDDTARATVGSVSGAAREVAALLGFALYAAGSHALAARWLFALAAVPLLLLALVARGRRVRVTGMPSTAGD